MPEPLALSVSVADLMAALEPQERAAIATGALDPREVWYEFVTLEDDHVRPSHKALHGTVWKVGDPNAPVPPLDYGCFLPGQRIRGVIDGAMRATYQGQAVEVTLQSGCVLRLTVNHPVVTDHGLVPAGAIQPGWKCRTDPRHMVQAAGDHKDDMPTVEEAFHLAAQLGAVGRRDVGRDDFHGDGQACYGEVEVVGSYGVLRNAGDAQAHQHAIDGAFPGGEAGGGLPGAGLPVHAREAGGLAGEGDGRGGVGSSGLPRARGAVHAGPLGALCLGLSAQLDEWGQAAVDNRTGDAQAFGERIDGLPLAVVHSQGGGVDWRQMQAFACGEGTHADTRLLEAHPEGLRLNPCFLREGGDGGALQVAPDEVREVRVFEYSGHVYDFRSPVGWILCNGAAVSNCRCSLRYVAPPGSVAADKGLLPPSPEATTDTVPAVYKDYLRTRLPGLDLMKAAQEAAKLPAAEQLPTLVAVILRHAPDTTAGQARDLARMAIQAAGRLPRGPTPPTPLPPAPLRPWGGNG